MAMLAGASVVAGSLTVVPGSVLATAPRAPQDQRRYVTYVTRDLVGRDPGAEQLDLWSSALHEGWPRVELTRGHVYDPGWGSQVVDGAFTEILGRRADDAGRRYWTARLLDDLSPSGVYVALAVSPEALGDTAGSIEGTVDDLYRALLGRSPDPAGLTHFSTRMQSGATSTTVASELIASNEGRSRRVGALYRRLLGRSADPTGLAHWSDQLAVIEDREVAARLAASREYFDRSVDEPTLPPIVPPTAGPVGPSTTTTATTSTTASTTTTTTTVPAHPEPEHFTGSVADFYVVPDPLPPGAPGTLIRYQDLDASSTQESLRVMYHSRDAAGRDRAVTGVVSFPVGRVAPDGGWPVVSTAHGTTGIAEQCAPSRWEKSAPLYGVDGVAVATDYIGLGPVGEVHSYLNGISEGNAMIDAVRAVRMIPEAHASNRWFSIGGSQGGHAALFGGERSATYAPELELLGTVAMAPPAAFDQTFGLVDEIVVRIIGVMMLNGAVLEHPEIDPNFYMGDQAAAAAGVLKTGCLGEIQSAYVPLAAAGPSFWKVDPRTVEPTLSFTLAQEPGLVATAAPMFVSSGTTDIQVNYQRERILVDRLCRLGQVVEFHEYAGADHGAVFALSEGRVRQWLAERLAGTPAVDSCGDPARPLPG